MRQFFKFMFASMLGVILSVIVLFFIIGGILAALVNSVSSDKQISIQPNNVLEITLSSPLEERSSKNPLDNFDFSSMKNNNQPGLNDILTNLKKAETDEHIKGIYLHVSSVQSGFASLEELRNALLAFKKSGKFIVSYAESYSQGAYYLASVSDKIYLNPQGEIDFKGLKAELSFFKGTFEKLEIEPEVIRHGKFKSAIEPFINDKMSDENRAQLADLLDDLWDHMLTGLSQTRQITKEELKTIANNYSSSDPDEALKLRLVDGLKYEDEVITEIQKKAGQLITEKFKTISLGKYTHTPEKVGDKAFKKEKIAVIYAVGTIESGSGDEGSIGSETFAETIRKARKDENIKAIVLRVNSPGGSALASEVIWREIMLAKKIKPVVVSMGDVAASGGYYISCGADTILAQENTITGSIGVFGLLFNAQKMLVNKLGITTDTYKTATFADMGTITRPLTEGEKRIMQNSVEKVYATFTGRVADGRKITIAIVDSIGQGRVWSGTDALRLGLVDKIGGIDDAIKIAARMAKIDKYRITSLPAQKEPFQEIMQNLKEESYATLLKNKLGTSYAYYKNMKAILKQNGIQAWMPFSIGVD